MQRGILTVKKLKSENYTLEVARSYVKLTAGNPAEGDTSHSPDAYRTKIIPINQWGKAVRNVRPYPQGKSWAAIKVKGMVKMARKDNKGRNLKNGESQRPDGRYMYRYRDEATGKRVTIYDMDLASLREREKQIAKDTDDKLVTDAAARKMTLNELFERYIATKKVKDRTKNNYISMWDNRVRNEIGNMKVVQMKASHIRLFYSKLSEEGLAHNTIKYLQSMIKPSLELAVGDDLIRKNPAKGALENYGEPPKEKEALTPEQQEKLLKFVEESKVYNVHLPMLQIMLGTCMRVSETIGLTWADVDMKAREVHVSGQLVYHDSGDGYRFHDTTPKTEAGVRCIPMTKTVYDAFVKQKELNFMLGLRSDVEIGGRSGFIFLTKHGRPIMPAGVNSFLKNIVKAYNKQEKLKAEQERRKPEYLDLISAHTLRHSGCTRLGENNVNPKVMQYVLGHSDMSVTMNVYNHISDKGRVQKEMEKMNTDAVSNRCS